MTEKNKQAECPEWCTSEHEREGIFRYHWGPRTYVYAEDNVMRDRVSVTPFYATGFSHPERPEVDLCSSIGEAVDCQVTHLGMAPGDARVIAEIIDTLSAVTPERQREFAEGIRASAQSIELETGPRQAEPEAGA